MKQSNPMKLVPHVHDWIPSVPVEIKLDGTIAELYRCSICNIVKRK